MGVQSGSLRRGIARIVALAVVGLAGAAALAGCPIYSDDECSQGLCGETTAYCSVNSDCSSGYVCSSAGRCVVSSTNGSCTDARQCFSGETCGRDLYCHAQDCTLVGCAEGTCLLAGGVAECLVLGDGEPPTTDAGIDSSPRTDGGDGGDGGDAALSDAGDAAP